MNRSRWLIALLVLSLAGNLATLGFIAGRASGGIHHKLMPDPTFRLGQWPEVLDAGRRAALKPIIGPMARGFGERFRDLRTLQREVVQAAEAEPFSQENLGKALQRFRRQLQASHEEAHRGFVEFMATLTPEERRRVGKSMQRRGPPMARKPRRPSAMDADAPPSG